MPPDPDDPNGELTTVHRVKKSENELLGVSRAFGDYDYKSNDKLSASRQAVVCTQEFVMRERKEGEDMFLVLVCDGLWDVVSNDEAGEFVVRRVADLGHGLNGRGVDADACDVDAVRGEVLARVGDDLLAHCLEKGSRYNMSVLIVAFPASGLLSKTNGLVSSSFRWRRRQRRRLHRRRRVRTRPAPPLGEEEEIVEEGRDGAMAVRMTGGAEAEDAGA